MEPVKLGIIGCGVISDAYLRGAARSKLVAVKRVADMLPEVATAKAAEHGVVASTADELLADPEIEIVVNLTVPLAHAAVSRAIIDAGKHVYSEKPLGITFAEAKGLADAAAAKGVRLGSAPDTFLGAGHQAARRLVDSGRIGKVVGGSACYAGRGMEAWHPNPFFFFQRGGGPALDVGPYPVTQLINLLGPVELVTALATRGIEKRTVGIGPRKGEDIPIDVPTTINAVLAFANGAHVSLTLSWDMWKHGRPLIELYGTDGSMQNPDPNFFGGMPRFTEGKGEWRDVPIYQHPFGIDNRTNSAGIAVADYRMIGVLDMAMAIRAGRPHRASGDLAMHVMEVLEVLERSPSEGRAIRLQTSCARPEPLALGAGEEVFLTGSA